MSVWTYVAGCIRIDGLEFLYGNIEKNIRDGFGQTSDWSDSRAKWDNCNVPCGSEGSVQYDVVMTGTDNSLSWGLVYIWGDLRDYQDKDEIYEWIKKACEKLAIRNCAVLVEIGQLKYFIYDEYDYDNSKTIIMMKEIMRRSES